MEVTYCLHPQGRSVVLIFRCEKKNQFAVTEEKTTVRGSEFTDSVPCDGRCSNTLLVARTYDHKFFTSVDCPLEYCCELQQSAPILRCAIPVVCLNYKVR